MVISMNLRNAVFGYARTAASARPRALAPVADMTGSGVCPLPFRSRRVDAVRIQLTGRPVQSVEQAFTLLPAIRFTKHSPGSTVLRPPV